MWVLARMSDDAARFRQRARKCRELAKHAKDEEWCDALEALARDLEDEAERIEAGNGR